MPRQKFKSTIPKSFDTIDDFNEFKLTIKDFIISHKKPYDKCSICDEDWNHKMQAQYAVCDNGPCKQHEDDECSMTYKIESW